MAGLYVHVPFCSQRCVYCDFYITTTSRDTGGFARAAATEIEAYGREFGEREPLHTLYLGGGTPSLLPPSDLAVILNAVHTHFDTSELGEVTLEANPEDLSQADLRSLRAMGVTRLSLGVQSFFDEDLAFMNRVHDAARAEQSVEWVAETFDSFSVDLIFGVPNQPFEHWGANLEKAVRLGATHVSTYSLTVEERTPLAKQVQLGTVIPEDDETLHERYLFTHEYLTSRGLEHYEVSSFARPGHQSRHNSLYWAHANVLAVGPSAHAFWRETRSTAWRWANVAHLGRWRGLLDAGHLPVDSRERLSPDTLADEAVLLGLRRLDVGLDLDRLATDYGVDLLHERADTLAALEGAGLLTLRDSRVCLTPEGATVADAVALRLIG
ncbi:MAG: radical SAM family heme chaperone HemW [Bacteroidota bacterium]